MMDISNAFFSTKLSINVDVKEVSEYKKGL